MYNTLVMRKFFQLTLLAFLLVSAGLSADEEKGKSAEEIYDLSGRWVIILSNDLSRKQVTFDLEQKDGRPRGEMSASGLPAQKLDGRISDDKTVFFWGTYRDRSGASYDYEFKGRIEGEPGQEKLVGRSDFFRKRYEFEGTRVKD